ncbi:uncharacterized protein EKO05_0003426 [Ascochyta rabiei]|uniref:uncharacterized protein n=1 Tax=Didymella rabiei TaxID=5454 RepID=UPI0021FB2714|nr:uncharacterized protein EKO05_0003426 [Ascochyta rabiei]UPX12893.1 hypothetical protein EKO05_0003426 [Ascochyta rabiei]
MNTDDCFRHFFLNTTEQTQLSAFLNQTADHILKPFPVGLASDVGLFVANSAYTGNATFAANFSRGDYHDTVVWGWQLAMMGSGLGRQLRWCASGDVPDFFNDTNLYDKALSAYNRLWELTEATIVQLSSKVSRQHHSAPSCLLRATFVNSGALHSWPSRKRVLEAANRCSWLSACAISDVK